MMIKVSELEEAGLTVEDPAAIGAPYADTSWRLDDVDLSVVPDGRDVLVQGRLSATVPQVCSRCLESFPAAVHPRVDVRLVPRPATGDNVELGEDDLDVDFYANDLLDLAALIETETTLALPMKPLCRDDCRGLCPTCGANRNLAPCECPGRTADPRLAVLGRMATRLHDTN
jgi:uncharacterized protein